MTSASPRSATAGSPATSSANPPRRSSQTSTPATAEGPSFSRSPALPVVQRSRARGHRCSPTTPSPACTGSPTACPAPSTTPPPQRSSPPTPPPRTSSTKQPPAPPSPNSPTHNPGTSPTTTGTTPTKPRRTPPRRGFPASPHRQHQRRLHRHLQRRATGWAAGRRSWSRAPAASPACPVQEASWWRAVRVSGCSGPRTRS